MTKRKIYGVLIAVFIAVPLLIAGNFASAQSADSPPTVPAGVNAAVTPGQPFQVTVTWTASTSTSVNPLAGYYVYRNGGLVATTAGTSIVDNILSPGVYSYTVAAYNTIGTISMQSARSQLLSIVSDTTPPSVPANLTAAAATSSVALSWSASTDNVSVAGYYIYRNGNKIPGLGAGAFTATSYTDAGLQPGNSFSYFVIAYDAAGNSSRSQTITVMTVSDVTPPARPSLSSAIPRSSSQIDVAWQPAADNVAVAGYYLYRNAGLAATLSATSTSYHDVGLSPATAYTYTLAAYDAASNISAQSYPVTATTFAPDTLGPTMPYLYPTRGISASEIDLVWQGSADNVGVAGYHLYRNGIQIANTTSTSYRDTGLATTTMYTYAVEAYDAAGNLSTQSTIQAETLATNPMIPATTTAASAGAGSAGGGAQTFAANLSFGARSAAVTALQQFLIAKGYLGPAYATGFYGALTQAAVQKFQCDRAVVCSGSPASTGWGSVGPKTRNALNAAN